MAAPLEGIKVVDFSRVLAGPLCGRTLQDLGAEVIKIEPPGVDVARFAAPVNPNGVSGYYAQQNAGKRNICLDLNKPEAKQVALQLSDQADILVENFRPGTLASFGLDYDTLARRNPGLIYLSISGFSQQGPLSSKPAMDPVLQAFTGFMMENKGQDGIPHRTNPIIVDMSTALYSFQAVSAALYAKRDEPKGRFIDMSLMAAATNLSRGSASAFGFSRWGGVPAGMKRTSGSLSASISSNAGRRCP